MRGLLRLLFLTLALAACQPAAQAPTTDAPIAEQTLPALDATPETAPETASPESPTAAQPPTPVPTVTVETTAPEAPPEAPLLAEQRHLCERAGGRLAQRAPGIFACIHPTRDGGRHCDEASDCEGLCLARSGTCAPFAPLYGCQEVFTLRDRRETLCTE